MWITPKKLKIAEVAQTTGTVDVFDPHSGILGLTDSRELPHVKIFMNDGPNLLT